MAAAAQWQRLLSGSPAPVSASRKRKAGPGQSSSSLTPATSGAGKASEQLYLDFGQRSFGRRVLCAQCGLMYSEGEPTDEENHRRHHRRVMFGVCVRGGAVSRIVAEAHGSRIACIHSSDGDTRLKKLREVKDLMDAELGSTPELPETFRAFLCFTPDTGRVVGCAIAEPLRSAYRLSAGSTAPDGGDGAAGDEAVAGDAVEVGAVGAGAAEPSSSGERRGLISECITHDGVAVGARCGVSHIWVAFDARRTGLARRLLDAVRRNMVAGFEVPPGELAFSQPTAAGRALAAAYTGCERFLVYS